MRQDDCKFLNILNLFTRIKINCAQVFSSVGISVFQLGNSDFSANWAQSKSFDEPNG